MRPDSPSPQLSRVRNSLASAREQPELHHGRSTARNVPFDRLLASLDSGFVDRLVHLVTDEVVAHRAMLTDVVVSASESLKMDLQSVVEFLRSGSEGVECLQLT